MSLWHFLRAVLPLFYNSPLFHGQEMQKCQNRENPENTEIKNRPVYGPVYGHVFVSFDKLVSYPRIGQGECTERGKTRKYSKTVVFSKIVVFLPETLSKPRGF